jgi:hypothetical protein
VTDRGERRLLWFLTLLVGVGLCVFSLSNSVSMVRLAFLPVGLLVIAFAIFRIRRLSRRHSRSREFEK